jgi:hypothetical protein
MMKLMRPRWFMRLAAKVGGWFWLRCPICDEHFAGFEAGEYGMHDGPKAGYIACRKVSCQKIAKASADKWWANAHVQYPELKRPEPLR